jgi:hypothetical protein
MKRVAPLRYDVIFKKAFCDPEIFTAFVNDTLVHDGLNRPMVQPGGSRTRLERKKCGFIYAAVY